MISSTLFSFVFALVAFLALIVPSSAQWSPWGWGWGAPAWGWGSGVGWGVPLGWGGTWGRGWGGWGWRRLSEEDWEEDEPLYFDEDLPMSMMQTKGLPDAEVMPTTPVVPSKGLRSSST